MRELLVLWCIVFSFSILKANPSCPDKEWVKQVEMAGGEVMADYNSVQVTSEDKTYYEVLFWDTKTGASKLYFYSYSDKKFKAYEENVQLPQRPLATVQGKVMADYTSVYVSSKNKTYYEVLFWDTKTGNSKLYFYSYNDKQFKEYEENVQLPANPLTGLQGEVMADYTAVHVPSKDKTFYEVLFWDTKTGKSRLYFYSYDDKQFKEYEENVQLPANPLTGVRGEIMADYTAVHVPSKDKTYYEVLFWDTKTGKSTLYYYSYSDKQFKAYEDNVQLPANPLNIVSGEVMADYTSINVPSQDKTYYEVLFWDTESGSSKLYFYSYNDKKFKAYEDNVQLPDNPLGNKRGSMMADYTSVYVSSKDKTYYEVLFWDVMTGRSKLYYYSYSDKKFKEYEENVQLPFSPLK